jgi:hypothetical protein
MCSPLHATFLSTGRHLPADPAITDDAERSIAEVAEVAEVAEMAKVAELAELPAASTGTDPDGPGAGSDPAPGSRREVQRC